LTIPPNVNRTVRALAILATVAIFIAEFAFPKYQLALLIAGCATVAVYTVFNILYVRESRNLRRSAATATPLDADGRIKYQSIARARLIVYFATFATIGLIVTIVGVFLTGVLHDALLFAGACVVAISIVGAILALVLLRSAARKQAR